jgi:Ser/Thr protein kinase RdoA (MazF antagonist)
MKQQGLGTAILQRVLAAYGLSGAVVDEPQKGYRNSSYRVTHDGKIYNLILYKSEPGMKDRIRHANQVSDAAASASLPTRQTLGRILQLKSPGKEKYACLYSYLPGETIPWEAYTKDHIKSLGAQLGVLHAVLQNRGPAGLPKIVDEYTALTLEMKQYFAGPGVQQAITQKLHLSLSSLVFIALEKTVEQCSALPDQQPLHMDFVRGNVLFQLGTADVTGILDFEKTAFGHPIFDLARTLAFLLVDCKYKTPDKIRKYFLQSGYSKRGGQHLPKDTYPLLKALTNLFLLHDFYKFLRHNPYEYLLENEHYIRTKDILIERKLVKLVE